jgi:hypothetical protein
MLVVTPVIRVAQLGDAERIGAIQVRAWQATYRGVMPDAYLDELDVDDRAAYWRGQVLALLPTQRLKVIGLRTSASCTPSTSSLRCGAVGSAEPCCAT